MKSPSDNDLRFFLEKSEARLKSVKKGQYLAKTLNTQRIAISHEDERAKETKKGAAYETVSTLIHRNVDKLPNDITLAMKEYISSKLFSPLLEQKKNENLENFFIEKYQIINSIFHDNKTKPACTKTSGNVEKKIELSDKNREKKKRIIDPFELRIRLIDEKIKRIVDNDIKQENLKRKEEQRKGIKFNFKKQKKGIMLTDKFYTLNMKAKHTLGNMSKMLEIQTKSQKSESNFFNSELYSMEESPIDRKFGGMNKVNSESSKIHFPLLSTKASRKNLN
ncbi:hypothetical protein SteCoe_17382 [Stentor coeruleus]|uniref:Uncharacterized protein n=1 Tax=Stentor coeruleus TaxID=5963 RepID=A0A1R2BZA3_9CILI|nr:hypothetical protein SteCoe_17382 [Stentor coeruleus]